MKIELSKEKADAIFKTYSDYIYKVALFLTNSKQMADDITQETFIQVFRKYHTYDSLKPMQPWIYKIALNITRNTVRRQKWLMFVEQLPERGCMNMVENNVLKTEEEMELWRAINNLSLNCKEVIILHFYSGMKLKEVSDTLGIPLGTCKSRLNSALTALRKQISLNEYSFLNKGGDIYESI